MVKSLINLPLHNNVVTLGLGNKGKNPSLTGGQCSRPKMYYFHASKTMRKPRFYKKCLCF